MFSHRIHALIPHRTLSVVALCVALLAGGCGKKPARTTPPVLVPSIESAQPAPPAENPPDENPSTVPETAAPDTPQHNTQRPRPKPRKPVRKPLQPAQPAPSEAAKPEPARPASPDPSAQITADIPRAAVQSQKQNTEQLLRNSDGKLSRLNRALSESEQGMLRQARNYIAQSSQALQGGDIERAYNLAVKASLLANELAK
jgi:outer membrane biosynthesis protein TonB